MNNIKRLINKTIVILIILAFLVSPLESAFRLLREAKASSNSALEQDTFDTMLWQTVTFDESFYEIWLVLNPDKLAPTPNAPLISKDHSSTVKSIYVTQNGDRLDDPVKELEIMYLAQNRLLIQDPDVWQAWNNRMSSIDDGELVELNLTDRTVSIYIPAGLNKENDTWQNVKDTVLDPDIREELYYKLFFQIVFPALDHGDINKIETAIIDEMGPIYSRAINYANNHSEDGGTNKEWLKLFLHELVLSADLLGHAKKAAVVTKMAGGATIALAALDIDEDIENLKKIGRERLARYIATTIYLQTRGFSRLDALNWSFNNYPNDKDPALERALDKFNNDISKLHDNNAEESWSPFFKEYLSNFDPNVDQGENVRDIVQYTVDIFINIGVIAAVYGKHPYAVAALVIAGTIWEVSFEVAKFDDWLDDTKLVLAQAGLALTLEEMLAETLALLPQHSNLETTRNLLLSVNHQLFSGYLFYRLILKRLSTRAEYFWDWFEPEVEKYIYEYKMNARLSYYFVTLPFAYLETENLWLGIKTRGPSIHDIDPEHKTNFIVGDIVQGRVQFIANTTVEKAQCSYYYIDQKIGRVWLPDDTDGGDGWGCNWNTDGLPSGLYSLRIYVTDINGFTNSESVDVNLYPIPTHSMNVSVNPERPQYAPGENVILNISLIDSNNEPVIGAILKYTIDGSPYDCDDAGVICDEIGNGDYSISFGAPAALRDYDIDVKASKEGYLPGLGSTTITVYEEIYNGHDVSVNDLRLERSGSSQIDARTFVYNNGYYDGTDSESITLIFKLRNPNGTVIDIDDSTTFSLPKGTSSSFYEVTLDISNPTDGSYSVEVEAVINGYPDEKPYNNKYSNGIWIGDKPTFFEYGLNQMWGHEGEWAKNSTGGEGVDNYYINILSIQPSTKHAYINIAKNSKDNIIAKNERVDFDELTLFDGNNFAVILTGILSNPPKGAFFDVGAAGNTGVIFKPGTAVTPAGTRAQFNATAPSSNWILRDFEVNIHEAGDDFAEVKNWYLRYDQDLGPWDQDVLITVPPDASIKTYEFWLRFDDRKNIKYADNIIRKLFIEVKPPHDIQISSVTPSNTTIQVGRTVPIDVTVENLSDTYDEFSINVFASVTGPNGYKKVLPEQEISFLGRSSSARVTFPWDTGGLEAGTYTFQVEAPLSLDAYPDNNKSTASIKLTLPPQIIIIASTDKSSYLQNEPVKLSASVSSSGSPLSGASVSYYMRDGEGQSVTSGELTENQDGSYADIISAPLNIGSYSILVRASKAEFLDGEDLIEEFVVNVAHPTTVLLNSFPGEGELTNKNDLSFEWIGSSVSTPIDQLEYSYKLNEQTWSEFSSSRTIHYSNIPDGNHTFYVKTRDKDGFEDLSPATRSFSIDSTPPVFDNSPTANLDQVSAGDILILTVDINEAVIVSTNLRNLDSDFNSVNVSVQEIDAANHVYELTYTLSAKNDRPDQEYILPVYIEDMAGNAASRSEIFVRLEDNDPFIVSFRPEKTEDVAVDSSIEIEFSEKMDLTSVESAFSVEPAVQGEFSWPEPTLIVFTPSEDLSFGTTYSVTLSSEAQDLAGKSLLPQSWSFDTIYADQPAVLTLTKTDDLNPAKYDTVGQVVTYTLTATNTGNVTLHNVMVTDNPALDDYSCTPASGSDQVPGASMVCTGTHTITQADLDAGSFLDTGTADSDETEPVDATDTIYAGQTAVLTLTKTDDLNPAKYDTVGQVVTYTLTATNTGNVTLHNVMVTDNPALDDYSCTPASGSDQVPGASMVCTGTHTITQADLDAGSFLDTGTADSDETEPVDATDTIYAGQTAVLTLTKTDDLNPAKYDTVGQVVTYTLTATNTGNVTLHNVTVTDNPALDDYSCTPASGSDLAPGASMVCTGTHTITQADLDAGSFFDTGTADSDETEPVNATDTIYADQTASAISGQVTDVDGSPLPDVDISIGSLYNLITDFNGEYSIVGLLPGDYTVTPEKAGFAFTQPSETVTLPPDSTELNFTGSSEGSVILKVSPLVTNTYIDHTFDVEIVVQAGDQTVDGAAAYLGFDPSLLQVVSITPGTSLSLPIQNRFDNDAGTIDYAAGTFADFPTGTFTLATITFEAAAQSDGARVIFNLSRPRMSDVTYGGRSVLDGTQDGAVIISDKADLIGIVDLQGRPEMPDPSWSVPVTVKLVPEGEIAPLYTYTPTTDEYGEFTIEGIPPGAYTILIKNSHTLQNMQVITLEPGLITLDFGTLREGDANDDNYVTMVDFSILVTTFGLAEGDPGFDGRADFNEDGFVTLLDFSLLASNFGQGGDSVGEIPQTLLQPLLRSGDVVISVEPGLNDVRVGDKFMVKIELNTGSQSVDGVQTGLNFNPGVLQVVQMSGNSTLFPLELQNQFDNNNGTLDYSAGTLSNFPSGDFTVLEVEFEAIADTGTSGLEFNLMPPRTTDVTFGGQSVLTDTSNGIVIVGSGYRIVLPGIYKEFSVK